ncbi:hypothetical protein [Streptomyces sp. NPDC048508]|uniref:hypothetical protein n=1 Tax=Streptomyces sp. NPDC048508 TaxID=3365561 RepID=UPI0037164FC8
MATTATVPPCHLQPALDGSAACAALPYANVAVWRPPPTWYANHGQSLPGDGD